VEGASQKISKAGKKKKWQRREGRETKEHKLRECRADLKKNAKGNTCGEKTKRYPKPGGLKRRRGGIGSVNMNGAKGPIFGCVGGKKRDGGANLKCVST